MGPPASATDIGTSVPAGTAAATAPAASSRSRASAGMAPGPGLGRPPRVEPRCRRRTIAGSRSPPDPYWWRLPAVKRRPRRIPLCWSFPPAFSVSLPSARRGGPSTPSATGRRRSSSRGLPAPRRLRSIHPIPALLERTSRHAYARPLKPESLAPWARKDDYDVCETCCSRGPAGAAHRHGPRPGEARLRRCLLRRQNPLLCPSPRLL